MGRNLGAATPTDSPPSKSPSPCVNRTVRVVGVSTCPLRIAAWGFNPPRSGRTMFRLGFGGGFHRGWQHGVVVSEELRRQLHGDGGLVFFEIPGTDQFCNQGRADPLLLGVVVDVFILTKFADLRHLSKRLDGELDWLSFTMQIQRHYFSNSRRRAMFAAPATSHVERIGPGTRLVDLFRCYGGKPFPGQYRRWITVELR